MVEGATSDSIPAISGAPQGIVLGPLLFLLFINDLPDWVQSRTRLFPDDCILYRQVKTQQDCVILQEDLNKLEAWDQKWGMTFHPVKCSTIRISRSRNLITTDYTLKGHTLTTEDYTKYLSVRLQSTFSWTRHIDQKVKKKKANSMVGFLRRNPRVSSKTTKTSAYYSMVRPLLEYCSTVWSPYTKESIQKIEMVRRRVARYVTNQYHNTSSVTSMLNHLL